MFFRTTLTAGGSYHSLITWWVFLNTKVTNKETAQLKCGNGNSIDTKPVIYLILNTYQLNTDSPVNIDESNKIIS